MQAYSFNSCGAGICSRRLPHVEFWGQILSLFSTLSFFPQFLYSESCPTFEFWAKSGFEFLIYIYLILIQQLPFYRSWSLLNEVLPVYISDGRVHLGILLDWPPKPCLYWVRRPTRLWDLGRLVVVFTWNTLNSSSIRETRRTRSGWRKIRLCQRQEERLTLWSFRCVRKPSLFVM